MNTIYFNYQEFNQGQLFFYDLNFYIGFIKTLKLYQNPVKLIAQQNIFLKMIKSIEGYSYKVNQHIGKGYSSTVHKGINDKSGQDVSIKVIEMSKLQDPINQMLLQHEVSALKTLSFSTNVLHLYDVYATKNNTYLITELMEGDLNTLLKQKKQFPYYEAVQILKQIIVGYSDIYNKGYLHRDIKPANVFYRKGEYKIGDFGFAIPIKEIHQHKNYNVGSPVYMPPEALKQNIYSVSCDTWAIGVIFFQLLKGIVPWRAISEQKLYEKIMIEPLSELTLGLPQAARNFLARILHLQPLQRMRPEQLTSWPTKLFAVEIRQMNPSPIQVRVHKAPLQQLQNISQIQNRDYSRSKSYSNSQPPNQVSGLRINLAGLQSQTNTLGPNVLLSPSPNTLNKFSSNMINIPVNQQNNGSKIKFQSNSNNFLVRSDQDENKLPSTQLKPFMNSSPEHYANCMISYIKFIHRVIKFIGNPADIPLKDLELSVTKFLFRQVQKIKKYIDTQNSQSLNNIDGWRDFIKSKAGQQKFIKSLSNLKQKFKMFCVLPKDQFVLDVYKQQLIDGIQKTTAYLQIQSNYSDKALISLDYLITFYQVWELKQKTANKSFKEFLDCSKVDKIMQGNPYNVQKQHFLQLKKKMKVLGLVNSYKQPLQKLNLQDLPQIKVNLIERAIRY